jgi:hypothetical protein
MELTVPEMRRTLSKIRANLSPMCRNLTGSRLMLPGVLRTLP